MSKLLKLYDNVFLRILLIIAVALVIGYLVFKSYFLSPIFLSLIVLVLIFELHQFLKKHYLFPDKVILSMLRGDFTTAYFNDSRKYRYPKLFKLYTLSKKVVDEQLMKDQIYQSILDGIGSGVIILKEDQGVWYVYAINQYIINTFKAPKVSKWDYLKKYLPDLCYFIEHHQFEECNTSLVININSEEHQFTLKTSKTITESNQYYMIVIDSIQDVVDRTQKQAWQNLMNVISHELLNSLAPIRTLSQNLADIVKQEHLREEDLIDIEQSVNTMIKRSDHLQQFVDSYRKLAMLPTPDKAPCSIKKLIESSLLYLTPLLERYQIILQNNIKEDFILDVDQLQIEQVIINLITNSIYAIEQNTQSNEKKVIIDAQLSDKRYFLSIIDTGQGISKDIINKIFQPFFTTRVDGAGIGLSLSKSIIEAHGGYLFYDRAQEFTTFKLCFIQKSTR